MTDAVVATNLQKHFGSVHAARGITLTVPAGARFGLIGQNGAGKTTFIKMLLGICRHDEGGIQVLGGSPEEVGVRRRIGYLPERLAIPPSFSALSFLDSVARFKGLSAAQRSSESKDLLHMVGLEEAAWKRKTGGYSKGMRQRTGLAAALVGKPELLILDEPTDGIDPMGRRQIRDVILEFAKGGSTIFLNSHLLAETERVCDHVAVLHQGAVVVSGALSVLQRKDSFRVVFVANSAKSDRMDVVAAAAAAGFVEDADPNTVAVKDDRVVTRFTGTDARALSQALQMAIGKGLVVTEVAPDLVELETILASAMSSSSPPLSSASPSSSAAAQSSSSSSSSSDGENEVRP
jgi:ABC-2 type transport system ATP-binding protein